MNPLHPSSFHVSSLHRGYSSEGPHSLLILSQKYDDGIEEKLKATKPKSKSEEILSSSLLPVDRDNDWRCRLGPGLGITLQDDNGKSDENSKIKHTSIACIKHDEEMKTIVKNNAEVMYSVVPSESSDKMLGDAESFCDISATDKSDSKYPESDVTINEDENFQYDSLKNDDHMIPLNIQYALDDSDDSLKCNVGINTHRSDISDKQHKNESTSQHLRRSSLPSSITTDDKDMINTEKDNLYHVIEIANEYSDINKSEIYNLKKSKLILSSTNGENEASPLVLVHESELSNRTDGNSESGRQRILREIQLVKSMDTVRKITDCLTSENLDKNPLRSAKIVIVRDKKHAPVVTTGTQTHSRYLHHSSLGKGTKLNLYKMSSSLTGSTSESAYNPLPNKVRVPWSSKGATQDIHYRKSILENFHRNFSNLVKAEKILKQMTCDTTTISNEDEDDTYFSTWNTRVADRMFPGKFASSSHISTSQPALNISTPPEASKSINYYPHHRFDYPASPMRLKEALSPILSIYGRESKDRSDWMPSHGGYKVASFEKGKRGLFPSLSLPDLKLSCRKENPRIGFFSASNETLNCSQSHPISRIQNLKSRSFSSVLFRNGESSDGSTESLIDEALRCSNIKGKESYYGSSSRYRPSRRARARYHASKGSRSHISPTSFSLSSNLSQPIQMREDSVSSLLQTRSDTDLRMVGKLSGGFKGQRPYLPNNREQLSSGQVVKVLVPGQGVALARVIYSPPNDQSWISKYAPDISVLLLSEPSNISGTVINIPLNKILLAWPKVPYI